MAISASTAWRRLARAASASSAPAARPRAIGACERRLGEGCIPDAGPDVEDAAEVLDGPQHARIRKVREREELLEVVLERRACGFGRQSATDHHAPVRRTRRAQARPPSARATFVACVQESPSRSWTLGRISAVSAQSCIRNRLFSTVGRPERPCTRQKARNSGLSRTQACGPTRRSKPCWRSSTRGRPRTVSKPSPRLWLSARM